MPFYGYNREDTRISEGVRNDFCRQGRRASFPASYFCIKAFSETEFAEYLARFDITTLALHRPKMCKLNAETLAAARLTSPNRAT